MISRPRMLVLVALSVVALASLFVVSWLIYMPVAALFVAPATLLVSFALDVAPAAHWNSLIAVALSGALATATVAAVLRILVARARARRRAPFPA